MEAQVLYILALEDHAGEPGFVSKLVGCFTAEQTDEQHDVRHPYADEIIAIIRKAQCDGVDVESDLRCRLRGIESEIEHIERTMNHE